MSASERADESRPSVLMDNSGQPIKLSGLQLNGVSAEAARNGDTVKVWTRLCLTSDDRLFHRVADGLNGHIEHVARRAGKAVNLKHAHTVLLVIHPDNTGDLWVDTAAVALRIMPKRDLVAGGIVFESDIADVTEMAFPLVPIGKEDRAVCIFREGWRFGLFFDFNPAGDISVQDMQRDLGTMHRRLRYRDLYDALADTAIFSRLLEAGWFPFVEIIGPEFRLFADCSEAGFDLKDEEAQLIAKFDSERLEHMFKRWMAKPHFAEKEPLLRSALRAFLAGEAVPVIKIVLTEIEGILADAYRAVHGKGAKVQLLLDFAIASAEQKAGQPDTLLFPAAFAHYLKSHTFANFDPEAGAGKATSRHAVGHGAAVAESYTLVRALQALLTLDQLAFYT
ncbi:hypothetical protein EDE08_103484 [Bradyrhizobium sp. R2.2-H]|nr:hypothetical protein [Bradyrhizobium sp. CCBAU 53380]TCU75264.1 hypothetical protein EDE10_103483 [Bradyrhizobium sp. Y-H1]TCU78032.1 hypothetical protein EDE08_103484 [Bradyrhizobium sp. R2.2-H]